MAREKLEDPKVAEGRRAFREVGEQADERPVVRREHFWESQEEMNHYFAAARACRPLPEELPRGLYHSSSLIMSKIHEIATRALGHPIEPEPKVIPFVRDPGQEG